MSDVIDRTETLSATRTDVRTTDRRRPGRMANPSPELIALMRKPSPEARRQLALYDAPNFVPAPAPQARVDVAHFARMISMIGACAGLWAGSFVAMMYAWG